MRIIKSFFIAFSMYSKIPMPQFEWKDEDMRYALCFFPWVGAVIGVLWYLWKWICARFGVGTLCYTVVGIGDTDSDHRGLSCGWIFRYL